MALPVKQPVNINFAAGLNQKADPYQVPIGNFLELVNTVFDKVGRLTKRNGFPLLATLPNDSTSYLATFNDDLQAIGAKLLAYSAGQSAWVDKGSVHPLRLSVMPLVRNSLEQTQVDAAIAPNGLICTVYTESDGSTNTFKYVVADSSTGQNIVAPTALPFATGTYGAPRVWVLGNYFFIVYTEKVSTPYTLNYLALSSVNPTATPQTGTLAPDYAPSAHVAFDGDLLNGSLYLAYNGPSASGIRVVSVSPTLVLSVTVPVDLVHVGTSFSVTADDDNQLVWVSYYDSGSQDAYALTVTAGLALSLSPTQIFTGLNVSNLASSVSGTTLTVYYEVNNAYSYDMAIPSHYVGGVTCTSVGVVGSPYAVVRSLGLASKAFQVDGYAYFLGAFQSPYQPSYFLIRGDSTEAVPVIAGKLAYSNGGGYLPASLPRVDLDGSTARIPYLIKDFLASQAPSGIQSINLQPPPLYSQTGANLATFDFDTDGLTSAEAANDLHLSGGFLWSYDGYVPVEHSFFLWPDSIEATWSDTGGSIHAKPDTLTNTNAYYYQVTYEWTDNQGNLFRSAPSIPVAVTTSGSGTSGSVALNIPTLRLTYKTASPVRIVIYRWSVANQSYFQVTSITTPLQNDLTADSVTYTDTLADASIVGNTLIYTTGGVLENVNAPASQSLSIFDNRLWLLDAEKANVFWYSKEIIEGTPADMSDLQTYTAVSPANAPGRTNFSFPMDDKLIQFKDNALCYTSGTGPTDTGANSQYSNPIFITSTVGSSNPRSAVMTPSGLMFQSNKGIWILGRDLSTRYIGAPVEDFNSSTVTSALAIPETNQVRFTLDTGEQLMYDYFVGQWGTFEGVPAVSSCVYGGAHTLVNQYGQVAQETPDTYLDGPNPVLMSFKTSWLNVAGLRGYLRAYWFYLLGTYLSPHKLQVELAYDYNPSAIQSDLITPTNWAPSYGSTEDPYYGSDGSTAYGGPGSIEQWRIFLQRQRCRAFQISIQEVFDPTYGTVAGPGLTLSGLSCILGVKKAWAPSNQNNQIG
jgi:hypothetical protein